MEGNLFSQLTIILGISLLVSTLFHRLGQPSILAYILVGCFLGPTGMGWVTSLDSFTFISEFGVVFLLFTLGLEFSVDRLIALRRAVFVLGGIQVVVCTSVFFAALYIWGTTPEAAFVLAGALAFSSTAIVTKLLSDRKELGFDYAQLAVGILLFQDLAAVVFLIITPTLAGGEEVSLAQSLSIALGKGVVLFIVLIAIGKYVLPRFYHEVAKTHSEEIFVLSTLVIVLASAWVTHNFHLSMALGGFVIGMMLGGSHFRHQIETDIRPFKDILLGLFFVSVGLQIDLHLLFDYWYRIIASAAALLVFKTILIALVGLVLGDGKQTSLRTGMVLSQGGEFGFALITMATLSSVIPVDVSSFMLLVIIASMIASPVIIMNVRKVTELLIREDKQLNPSELGPSNNLHSMEGHVIVGGFGRIGQTVAHFLELNNFPYVAMDTNVNRVAEMRKQGNHNVIYGDCNKLELLKACGIKDARLVVLSFRSLEDAVNTVRRIRKEYADLPIIVRAHHESAFDELISAGANHIVPEMLEASFMVATHTMTLLGCSDDQVLRQIQEERDKRFGFASN